MISLLDDHKAARLVYDIQRYYDTGNLQTIWLLKIIKITSYQQRFIKLIFKKCNAKYNSLKTKYMQGMSIKNYKHWRDMKDERFIAFTDLKTQIFKFDSPQNIYKLSVIPIKIPTGLLK